MKPENKLRVLEKLSAEMRQVMQFQAENPQPTPAGDDFPSQRNAYNAERRYWNEGAPEMLSTTDIDVPGPYGHTPTRIYLPQEQPPAALFYLHGGAFILGNLDTHSRIMRLLARYTGCAVIGVDYSLSPEARYPQAIEETVSVCQFYRYHAEQCGLNMTKIGFAGDSAGAMLALASALWIRDRALDCGQVAGVMLWYGLYGLQDSASRRLYGGSWDGLTRSDLAAYDAAYLRSEADRESPYYCLFNNDLTQNVPPCFIASAEYDPLIDDSVALYRTLQEHGQACQYSMYPGTLHAFLHYSRMMKTADEAIRDGARYFVQHITC
ncbi:acetyl esterase [Trabulsiella odontotermitis]|uniref:acetyl esterase n=1 Tax=Trabulsiella odontotermitis TaxID=379893 RepID=UPI003ACFE24A